VHKALTEGKDVSASSPLGARYQELAESMLVKKTPEAGRKRGFIDKLTGKKAEVEA
jgi:hypothetical protein